MHVRAYRIEDAEPLMRLYTDTVHQVNGRDYSPRQIAAWARRQGITELHSEVSLTSRAFFERHGFWVVRTQEVAIQGQPIETFVMERTLAASGLMKALA